MPKMLGLNIGFITNSSSAVYHFPRSLLAHPKVKKFIETFELSDGFVGSDLWRRDTCTTIAMTREQKKEASAKLADSEYCTPPAIDVDDDSVLIIYGDEYESIARSLASVMEEVARAENLFVGGQDYN